MLKDPTPDLTSLDVEVPLFRVRKGIGVGFSDGKEKPFPPTAKASPLARNLALGHRLRRAMERGEVQDLVDLAAAMKVSRQHVSVLLSLTYLAPDLQERVLQGSVEARRLSRADLLALSRLRLWAEQRRMWRLLVGRDPVVSKDAV